MEASGFDAGVADFLDDRVTVLGFDDPLMYRLTVFVSGDEDEPSRMRPHLFVFRDAEHHSFETSRIGAFAEERQPVRRLESM
ncbi:MAG TPA: hypothetical protein VHQ99_00595 [Gaiellaceae bacterium]|nr:hypothetical protein [Gaiellaceae bacterium]